MNSAGLIACVVDAPPVLHTQALRWYTSLHALAGVAPSDMMVLAVNGTRSQTLRYLAEQGVQILDIPGFDERSPNCNKICAMAAVSGDAWPVIAMTDCDVAFLSDPRDVKVAKGAITAKQVDTPNPPIDQLIRLVKTAGLELPAEVSLDLVPGERTLRGYANGGLYIGPPAVFARLSPAWSSWAKWILERNAVLEIPLFYIDQSALLLALIESGIVHESLDISWNCPTHLKRELPRLSAVHALHYHRAVDAVGNLKPTANPTVNQAIERVNTAFANARYATGALLC